MWDPCRCGGEFYVGNKFPFEQSIFDSVLCSQVLEHVFTPIDFLNEINRVMKDGGTLLLTVPFVWDEHEQPYDFARYSSFGLKYMLEETGFEILEHEKLCDNLSVVAQIINIYVFKISQNLPRFFRSIITLLIIAPTNIIGIIMSKIIPANKDLFLDQIVVCKKKK